MSSDARINASRENGKLGGVKTPEGKERSSRNAFRHGLYAKRPPVLSTEDRAAYDALADSFRAFHQPRGIQEAEIVQQLIDVVWRYQRYEGCQEWMLEMTMSTQADAVARENPNGVPNDARHAIAVNGDLSKAKTSLRELSRLLDRLLRAEQRLLATLKDLQGPRFNTGEPLPQSEPEKDGNEPRTLDPATSAPAAQACWTPKIAARYLIEDSEPVEQCRQEAPPLVMAA